MPTIYIYIYIDTRIKKKSRKNIAAKEKLTREANISREREKKKGKREKREDNKMKDRFIARVEKKGMKSKRGRKERLKV